MSGIRTKRRLHFRGGPLDGQVEEVAEMMIWVQIACVGSSGRMIEYRIDGPASEVDPLWTDIDLYYVESSVGVGDAI